MKIYRAIILARLLSLLGLNMCSTMMKSSNTIADAWAEPCLELLHRTL